MMNGLRLADQVARRRCLQPPAAIGGSWPSPVYANVGCSTGQASGRF